MNKAKLLTKMETSTTMTPTGQIHKRLKTDHIQLPLQLPTPIATPKPEPQPPAEEDDTMFGDDLALEELDLTAIIEKKKYQDMISITPKEDMTINDSFDDLPLDELGDVLMKAEKNVQQQPTVATNEKRQKFTRYLVANMTHETYTFNENAYSEKVLILMRADENRAITARLRQEWEQTIVVVGDVVHIPYITNNTEEIIIDNQKNFIIIHPDKLISCTAVADSFSCLRKSVLQMKVKNISQYTEALVYGNIIHQVVQSALQTSEFSIKSIKQEIERIVMNSLEDLYAMDQDEQTALCILNGYAHGIHEFGTRFVNKYPKPNAHVSTDMGSNAAQEMGCKSIAICDVLDIEEHLWSPTYGLKGMVDASVQLRLSPTNKVLTVPFELKTGKASRFLTDRAQTLLYTLLMSDRYDIDIGAGILYYSKTNSLYLIPSSRNDLRSLIMARNYLAIALNNQQSIPPMIKNIHTCQYCYINDACAIYHKAIERGNSETSGLYKLFDDKTDHMTKSTSDFFRHWWKLLEEEEKDIDYIRKDIWSQPAHIREMSGRCLSNMVLNLNACQIDPEITQWKYSFVRTQHHPSPPLLTNILVGDPVVVSSMEGHIHLAMGFVVQITTTDIMLRLSEPLRNPPQMTPEFEALNHQTFRPFIRLGSDVHQFYSKSSTQYRIDKDEMSSGMVMLRNNLVMLTAKSEENELENRRLRELIIDLKKPDYHTVVPKLPPMPNMNPDQRNALKRVLQAKDYNLILGMPGTGKTTTTAEIINYLVKQNKSVLVAAYTHTALDNVLSKVREYGIDLLRLGNVDKVMPCLRDCVPSSNNTIKSVAAMQSFYDTKKVVGVTCLGIGHILLKKRVFDYCIIDEASQITLPTCIGPLRYAKTFVLVGDLYQLPPIARSKEATEGGLDKSLFSILAEARPESISYLEYQYRMAKEIMDVSNVIVYGGKLKCGNFKVASRQMQLPRFETGLQSVHENSGEACNVLADCWLRAVLDTSRKVVFVNTDELSAKETRPFGSFLQNTVEANLIYQLVETMLRCGVSEEQLAVISVYRSQLRLISQALRCRQDIEVATIDKYQGRDKECVLLSLVRNNTQGNAGDLLRDWRRLNVAITRAKSKLIIFGSSSTLKATALYSYLIDFFEKKGWVYDISRGSELMHQLNEQSAPFEDENTKPKHKTFLPTAAVLKKNEILRDIYNNEFSPIK